MPIYEYHCDKCNKNFETIVFGDETPKCPECDGTEVRKLMSACSFFSKGAGGETTASSNTSSCSGCTATSCSTCGQ